MKRPSKTTLAGTVSAACFAGALAPGLHTTFQIVLCLAGCVSLALLGKSTPDCPPKCPGTDDQGRPLIARRITLPTLIVLAAFAAALLFNCGCVTKNPNAGPTNPTAPAYIVNPTLTTTSNTIVGMTEAVAPFTGTGSALPLAVNGIFGLIGALSLLWARHKSAVTDTMAAGVAKAGVTTAAAVLASASDSPKFAAVAEAINEQLAAGQAPGQPLR